MEMPEVVDLGFYKRRGEVEREDSSPNSPGRDLFLRGSIS